MIYTLIFFWIDLPVTYPSNAKAFIFPNPSYLMRKLHPPNMRNSSYSGVHRNTEK